MARVSVPIYRVALVRDGRQGVESRVITSPAQAAQIFRDYIGDADREVFAVMALTTRSRVIGVHTVSIGTLESATVHPREVFKPLLLLNAAMALVAHNHPSGDSGPSPEDRQVTSRLAEAGKLLGIELIDHIILGDEERFTSLKELGMM